MVSVGVVVGKGGREGGEKHAEKKKIGGTRGWGRGESEMKGEKGVEGGVMWALVVSERDRRCVVEWCLHFDRWCVKGV